MLVAENCAHKLCSSAHWSRQCGCRKCSSRRVHAAGACVSVWALQATMARMTPQVHGIPPRHSPKRYRPSPGRYRTVLDLRCECRKVWIEELCLQVVLLWRRQTSTGCRQVHWNVMSSPDRWDLADVKIIWTCAGCCTGIERRTGACDVIHNQGAHSPSIVCFSDGTESLLPCGVPDLRLDLLAVDLDRACCKLYPNCLLGFNEELITSEAAEKVGLSYRRVANEHNLVEVVIPEQRQGGSCAGVCHSDACHVSAQVLP